MLFVSGMSLQELLGGVFAPQYRLTESKCVVECKTAEETKIDDDTARLAYTEVTTRTSFYVVSTVFTGTDLLPSATKVVGKPHVFETRAIGWGPHNNMHHLYSDWDLAMIGHYGLISHILDCEGQPSLWRLIRGWLYWKVKGTPDYVKNAKRSCAKWYSEKGLSGGSQRPAPGGECGH